MDGCRYLWMAIRKLTDDQWQLMGKYIPSKPPNPKGGRPWADDRSCLEGILWIMSTGAQWAELPKTYPGYATCWRRLRDWEISGIFVKMWQGFLSTLDGDDRFIWQEAFADGTFAAAKKGVQKSGKRARARGPRS